MIFVGSLAIDLGATTGMVYCFRDRERIMDMFEMSSGQRMIASYMRLGGISADLPESFYPAVESFINDLPGMIAEYHGLISGNEILQERCKDVGILSAQDAVAYGVTGPNLRASGVDYDLRRDDPYGIYPRFEFRVPTGQRGDSWDRFMVRIEEMEQSGRIIKQALRDMPSGEIQAKVPRILKPEKGREVYHRVESSKGELGFHLVSDGSDKPYRVHVRAPSFINLMVLPLICRGGKLQDVITNIATLDPVLGESDR
jgi:NADH-quinone oxidoreductase subunit D